MRRFIGNLVADYFVDKLYHNCEQTVTAQQTSVSVESVR